LGVRVGVDGLNLAMAQGTGVATYARTLCQTLVQMGSPVDGLFGLHLPHGEPEALREVLFFAALDPEPAPPPKPTLKRALRRAMVSPFARRPAETRWGRQVVGEAFQGRLPAFDRLFSHGSLFELGQRYFRRYGRFMPIRLPDPPAIMHWTYPLPLRVLGAANIYTIHDLVPLRLPHTTTEDKRYHYRLIQACLAQAARICTVSEASRRDILEMFPQTGPERVVNTYQTVTAPAAARALPGAELDARLQRLFDLQRGNYLLYFGALEPKKNIGRLVEAYLAADIDTPLVIVGSRAWRAEKELRLLNGAHGHGLKGLGRIRRLDYLPEALLMLLVRGAKAVVFPSLYEGFGLPALEAMALGVPVLASTTGSLPEVTGGAAVLVNPYDVGEIAAGLTRLDGDAALRERLASAGPRQAERFSSAAYIARLEGLYRGLGI
jgi:glycosyltransferase involved in cell wall biosynthesis